MTEKDTNIIPLNEIGKKAFEATVKLLKSSQLKSFTTTKLLDNGEGVLAECVTVETPNEDTLVPLATFGTGGIVTNATVKSSSPDSVPLEYHTEFYTIAADEATSKILLEDLFQLAFLVDKTKSGFLPGMMMENVNNDPEYNILFTPQPLGVAETYSHPPLLTEEFGLFFTAVTRLYSKEVELIKENKNEGIQKIHEFLKTLGTDAYLLNRPQYGDTV